ncbi:MAG: hypothetical protein R6V39_11470 [Desulfovibrionales bacterium]
MGNLSFKSNQGFRYILGFKFPIAAKKDSLSHPYIKIVKDFQGIKDSLRFRELKIFSREGEGNLKNTRYGEFKGVKIKQKHGCQGIARFPIAIFKFPIVNKNVAIA